jgi:chloride channel 7
MITMVFIGVAITLYMPVIGGSGLPALISELNGSKVPELLSFKSLVGKVCGAVMAVGSGLACGPEGPIIHIGGCVGSLVLRRRDV